MSLIQCRNCGGMIARSAPGCVHCGAGGKVQTIQKTGKRFKGAKVVIGLGVILAVPKAIEGNVSALVILIGLLVGWVVVGVLSWWNHG